MTNEISYCKKNDDILPDPPVLYVVATENGEKTRIIYAQKSRLPFGLATVFGAAAFLSVTSLR